ncbi:hypothetical protein GCM10011519_07340 [Marmoricola endophyticus]|uniref:UvrD-like helicase C-terminal domain-containing protein n=1 Tax=Marmoricola endophyticus TaxID=2040280 RepID=A0A917BBU4_9ACTN|nr:hypothetical protein [Marmoricola endophyticus]GGF36363.1 hypothetical protein GCM10011519_07340 [Marmoricola endophyticus]
MRAGEDSADIFDTLLARGDIVIHASEVERLAAVAETATAPADAAPLLIADTREQVSLLNAAIRDRRLRDLSAPSNAPASTLTTSTGEQISSGDRIATRRNDRDLGVANRDTWTVTAVHGDGALDVRGRPGERTLPADYTHRHVELAFATTVHGAQGDTVDNAHLLIDETTGAASAYVGMTRGRQTNTAHLVAETVDDARAQWVDIFHRDRADLGPSHAAEAARDAVERLGTQANPLEAKRGARGIHRRSEEHVPSPACRPPRGIGR